MVNYVRTQPEVFVVSHRIDGRERVVTVEEDLSFRPNSTFGDQRWKIKVTHPDGMQRERTCTGSALDAQVEAISFAEDHRRDFIEAAKRGDRQFYQPDTSVPLPSPPVQSMTFSNLRYRKP